MKRYGMRIGDIGIEFASRDERQKAVGTFTLGIAVKISDSDVRYRDGKGEFSTYERDDKEVLVNCAECQGVFGSDGAPKREYPQYQSWNKTWEKSDRHICDGCFETKRKAKEVADAKAVIEKSAQQ